MLAKMETIFQDNVLIALADLEVLEVLVVLEDPEDHVKLLVNPMGVVK